MTISPGALVTCHQTSTVLYVVVRQNGDGSWHLRSKMTDHKGREVHNGRSNVGAGDIVVIKSAPQFEAHEMLEHDGRYCEILRDLGAEVELLRPEYSNGAARVPSGKITVAKSDIVLDLFR